MGLVPRMPMLVEQREKEAQHLTKSQDLLKLSAEHLLLGVRKKLYVFEGVTASLGPKNQQTQDCFSKIDSAIQKLGNKSRSRKAAQDHQP